MNDPERTRYKNALFLNSLISLDRFISTDCKILSLTSLVSLDFLYVDYRSSKISLCKFMTSLSFSNSSFFLAKKALFLATARLMLKYILGTIRTREADTMLQRLWILNESYQVPRSFWIIIAVNKYPNTTPSGGEISNSDIIIGF